MVTMVIIATADGDNGDDCFDCVTYSKRSTHPYGRNVIGIMHDPGKASGGEHCESACKTRQTKTQNGGLIQHSQHVLTTVLVRARTIDRSREKTGHCPECSGSYDIPM